MNYELALELKNAGFPQLGEGHYEDGASTVYHPTLEELIEACEHGGRFIGLSKLGHETWATYGSEVLTQFGSTPLEAVARLWLALNKK